jgi:hypothetical protein
MQYLVGRRRSMRRRRVDKVLVTDGKRNEKEA